MEPGGEESSFGIAQAGVGHCLLLESRARGGQLKRREGGLLTQCGHVGKGNAAGRPAPPQPQLIYLLGPERGVQV